MMWKAAGAGKCAFEMISRDLQVAHHQKISPSPILQIGGVFCIDVDQESLINKQIEK